MCMCVCFVCARSLAFGYQPVLALFSLHASFFWLQWSYLRAQIFYFCHHRSSKWLFTYLYERMQLGAVAVAARRFFLDSPRCWLSACGVCCFLRFKKFFSSSGFATFFPQRRAAFRRADHRSLVSRNSKLYARQYLYSASVLSRCRVQQFAEGCVTLFLLFLMQVESVG